MKSDRVLVLVFRSRGFFIFISSFCISLHGLYRLVKEFWMENKVIGGKSGFEILL